MSRIPQTFIDDLLSRTDIVDVIDKRVKLKKTGKNYAACCPFHDEKTPSFSVSPDKQFYYCFGCGASGNAIGFVMEYERQSFVESIENLAQAAGLEVPKEANPEHDKRAKQRQQLYKTLEKANEFYQTSLKSHAQRDQAVQYLKGRDLSPSTARDYGLGYAPPGWDNLLKALADNEQKRVHLIKAGLVIDKPETNQSYDRFRQRIMFPIIDVRGRIIGFGGRVLGDDKPKYLNSPETEVYQKSKELYGLYQAKMANRQLSELLVVEGYMDVIALAQFGLTYAAATLGTACGEDHLRLAFKHTEKIIFCFDGDAAGTQAAKRALSNSLTSMTDGRQIQFLFLPDGHDPDSLIRQIGLTRFTGLTEKAISLEDFLFDVAAENIDTSTMEGRARFSKTAAPMIAKIPNGIYKELMLESLAKRTGLSKDLLIEIQDAQTSAYGETATPVFTPKPTRSNQPAIDDNHIPDGEPPATIDDYSTYVPEQLPLTKASSSITLTPERVLTLALLENPALIESVPANLISEHDPKEEQDLPEETLRLHSIIHYLKRRPGSSVANILGFWAGVKGVKAQNELAQLVANDGFGQAKKNASFNLAHEVDAAVASIQKRVKQSALQIQLNQLKAIPSKDLTTAQKQQLVRLITEISQLKKN